MSVCNGGVDVEISIRAPARGATYVLVFDERVVMISIRAPARGATGFSEILWFPAEFQSALPRGERPASPGEDSPLHTISIRAPARGATKQTVDSNFFWAFQSALPRGERQRKPMLPWLHRYFNPRSREGSDYSFFYLLLLNAISIRAPARGATNTVYSAMQ